MVFNEKLFKEDLVRHKKWIASLGRLIVDGKIKFGVSGENEPLFTKTKQIGKELCLGLYIRDNGTEFKNDLQFHHLIGRGNKKILPAHQYATQRNYFANVVVIPQSKHKGNFREDGDGCISKEFFNKVVERYFKKGMNKKYNKVMWNICVSQEDSKIIEEELNRNTNWEIISQILIKWGKEGLLEKR